MFKIESYITPILLSYVDKYVRDFKPGDAQVSLWGGGVALHNLVIKADVLQKEVALPFTLVSGRIHELLIQVPWTKIMSEPIVVTIDTIECVLSLNAPDSTEGTATPDSQSSRRNQVVEAPPGYMQALVRGIINNIAVRVHHLIVKYVQDDIVMSLNIKHLAADSASSFWEPAFAEIDQEHPVLRRIVRLDDLTLCLDKADSDGKIRFYQEPLLYRCQLDLKMLTRLASVNSRRSTSLSIQLWSKKLAWSVTNEQLTLLLRLINERPAHPPAMPLLKNATTQSEPASTPSSVTLEPGRTGSWSEWAWSWLPSWSDTNIAEEPATPTPLPIHFNAYLDDVSLVCKVMEVETARKRARPVLEFVASYAALTSMFCKPTTLRAQFGTRDVILRSYGKCVCGFIDNKSAQGAEATVYLKRIYAEGTSAAWQWPEQGFDDFNTAIEVAQVVEEDIDESPINLDEQEQVKEQQADPQIVIEEIPSNIPELSQEVKEEIEEGTNNLTFKGWDALWTDMSPFIYAEFTHNRQPPEATINPYDNPPKNFEYSDWFEDCTIKVKVEPIQLELCMGFVHRLEVINNIFQEQTVVTPELPMRTLTVEELDALQENLPQRRVHIDLRGIQLRTQPYNHSRKSQRGATLPAALDLHLPTISVTINTPLYSHRVCSAAFQMPQDRGVVAEASQMHVTVVVTGLKASITSVPDGQSRPCARADVRLVCHKLLHPNLLGNVEKINKFRCYLRIKEVNICGSYPRLQTALHIPMSLYNQEICEILQHTNLIKDALNDEEAVAIDLTLEELVLRGFMASNVNTVFLSLQSAKATAFHAPKNEALQQAWLFSGPDERSSSRTYFRMACQYCPIPRETTTDFLGLWIEPTATSMDPMLITWLAYSPQLKYFTEESTTQTQSFIRPTSSIGSLHLRRTSSSGRKTGSGSELVHMPSRSQASSSELSERKLLRTPPLPPQPKENWWEGERLMAIYERMRTMLVLLEVGQAVVYVTNSSPSALDCATIRDSMDRHASEHGVMVFSLGRLSVHTNPVTKALWDQLQNDGPTYFPQETQVGSFPWLLQLSDVSCYSLDLKAPTVDSQKELKSRLKSKHPTPTIVLEPVTTTITVSVVTRALKYKTYKAKDNEPAQVIRTPTTDKETDEKEQYFNLGTDFKPTTLKEFIRGPKRSRKSDAGTQSQMKSDTHTATLMAQAKTDERDFVIMTGPTVSLGINVHADTPPIVFKLQRNQLHMVTAALHGLQHVIVLLKKPPVTIPKHTSIANLGLLRTNLRIFSGLDEQQAMSEDTDDHASESEINVIYDRAAPENKMSTFFWLQWVVGNATLILTSENVKIVSKLDDIITTVDLQSHYNQLKVKIASAYIKYYDRSGEEWALGSFEGRVLEVKEPANTKEDNTFLAVTITRAKVSNLPTSWKDELHPKMLQQMDIIWEVYTTLAPLEVILHPYFLEQAINFSKAVASSSCVLQDEYAPRQTAVSWPFLYMKAGGLKVYLTADEQNLDGSEDTFIFTLGKLTMNPHPENPICRRLIGEGSSNWSPPEGGYEGRQYEAVIKDISISSANILKVMQVESGDLTSTTFPAFKWSQRESVAATQNSTLILHPIDISCVLAPPIMSITRVTCAPAVELNLVTDCFVEFSIHQILMLQHLLHEFSAQHMDVYDPELWKRRNSTGLEGMCHYASLQMTYEPIVVYQAQPESAYESSAMSSAQFEMGKSVADSGLETIASASSSKTDWQKKTYVTLTDNVPPNPFDYLELFVTMGPIDVALYVKDDGSPEVKVLRLPHEPLPRTVETTGVPGTPALSRDEYGSGKTQLTESTVQSLTETAREMNVGKDFHLDLDRYRQYVKEARRLAGNLPLVHVTLYQPNLYYWKNKSKRGLQVSLFNTWIGLGLGPSEPMLTKVLLSTTRGAVDPDTEIPPALCTMKLTVPYTSGGTSTTSASRGSVQLDIERPVQVEMCSDRLKRLVALGTLLKNRLVGPDVKDRSMTVIADPVLHKFRVQLMSSGIETISINMSQLSMSGPEGVVGWDTATAHLTFALRPERITARTLVTALLVATGTPDDIRHVLLQPFTMGVLAEARWEAWRRAEGGPCVLEPSVRVGVELDSVSVDLRPADLEVAWRLKDALSILELNKTEEKKQGFRLSKPRLSVISTESLPHSTRSSVDVDNSDHYYQDDLRSGAFKILTGGQMPMAYQVVLSGNAVSWRYPHPRAITRIVAFPLPGQDREIECVLELYSLTLDCWSPHTYFSIPVGEPRELQLYIDPQEVTFSTVWRFRTCESDKVRQAFKFSTEKFLPKADTVVRDASGTDESEVNEDGVTAEQLSGVLRVDSYFAPRLVPLQKITVRLVELNLWLNNSVASFKSNESLEGYYVSKSLARAHRIACVSARDFTAHAQCSSPAGVLVAGDTYFTADILDSTTGTMEQLIQEFHAQAALSKKIEPRMRVMSSVMRLEINMSRLHTIQSLANDWKQAIENLTAEQKGVSENEENSEVVLSGHFAAEKVACKLDGCVSLWLHNTCAVALRVGQEGTKEALLIGSGTRLAYRWCSPDAPKKIQFALATQSQENIIWSAGIPFAPGSNRVRLEETEEPSNSAHGAGMFVYVRIDEAGTRRRMHISARLVLANILRFNLMYKVRVQNSATSQYSTLSAGELTPESVGRSVICPSEGDMMLKIKLLSHDTGWSGDIPLRECPKENVPWLVKVPSEGAVPYVSVWCRVSRARCDGRILASLWPLYVLYSYLPLDTDGVIVTENTKDQSAESEKLPPLIHTFPGRGCSTHLSVPGTTHARHNITLQYKTLACPVTREAIPLHYGVTDSSVFEKRAPVQNIDDVIKNIFEWLDRSSRNAQSAWPYSIVRHHRDEKWEAALMQPRSDIAIRYSAVSAGGGCSLELRLCPIVILCNATSVALTLRAHDAAPLCRLESCNATAPPKVILTKPFYISIEVGRETYVSAQLELSSAEPGRYGKPPSGHVVLEHETDFHITCRNKVALLTMYYEIIEDINVLGITSTFMMVNRLKRPLMVSSVVTNDKTGVELTFRQKSYKIIQPTKEGSMNGTPLCQFWIDGRWHSNDAHGFRMYVYLGLGEEQLRHDPVPVRVGSEAAPVRRAVGLRNEHGESVPVVLTQTKQDCRNVIVVAPDPCPQFFVCNRTLLALCVAEPTFKNDHSSAHYPPVARECPGASWWCTIEAGSAVHYSTPSYCARYPLPATASYTQHSVPYLTFSKARSKAIWCPPVAVTDGEHLLQIQSVTLKMRVHTHPHSTLIELQKVDTGDISASDIRKRLTGSLNLDIDIKMTEPMLKKRTSTNKGLSMTETSTEVAASTSVKEEIHSSQVAEDSQKPSLLPSIPEVVSERNMSPLSTRSLDLLDMDMEWDKPGIECELARCVVAGIVVTLATSSDAMPVLAVHLDRTALLVISDKKKTKMIVSIADAQVDNLQYESGHYDFAVVASTRSEPLQEDRWPSLWTMFVESDTFAIRHETARLLLKLQYDKWTIQNRTHSELTEVELKVGTLSLYIEDAYVSALVEISRLAKSNRPDSALALAEERSLQRPLRLRKLYIHPLDLTLTLHTAVRMYIALDQSPLNLNAFELHDMMTSAERLSHSLTVHYLSAAILGAGWVVGGLELLGAPGSLAARVGGASGGVRGVASAAAAALLRSLSAWAGSLARNLDLLAGDEEHARRAAAARRRPPDSFVAGLLAGITNFAINMLGAVGGLAHHPLVGVAVGETESGTAALRRGLLGALTKPLSATADLVAYAGHGLLRQTGWDPVPQPRQALSTEPRTRGSWKRDCVRWTFRLTELTAITGYQVLVNTVTLQLLLTHKFLIIVDPDSENIMELIDYRLCTLKPALGQIIELHVKQKDSKSVTTEAKTDEDDECQVSAAAMARVARYTGAGGAEGAGGAGATRVLSLLPPPGDALALHAALAAAIHHNQGTHFPLL